MSKNARSLDAGQQRGALRERRQMLAGHRSELVGMPEGELAQQDPQRRGRVHLVEHPGRAAGAQHVHIVDAVRAAHHARDDRGQLPGRIDRARGHPCAGQVDMLADQTRKTGLLSQFHAPAPNQPPTPDSARRTPPTRLRTYAMIAPEMPSEPGTISTSAIDIVPVQEAFSLFTRRSPKTDPPRIQAKSSASAARLIVPLPATPPR